LEEEEFILFFIFLKIFIKLINRIRKYYLCLKLNPDDKKPMKINYLGFLKRLDFKKILFFYFFIFLIFGKAILWQWI